MPSGNPSPIFGPLSIIPSSKRRWRGTLLPWSLLRIFSRGFRFQIYAWVPSTYTKAGKAFTELVLETFRFNGRLLLIGDRLARPVGLTSSRWQVLGAIEEQPLSVAQIARNMGLARQNVQRLADALQKEGIIHYA